MQEFLTMYPLALAPVVIWCVWRIHALESNHISKMREDIAEIKNDIKWLVKAHEDKN